MGATLPEPTEGEPTVGYALYHPRAALDNGRVFFNAVGPLVVGDSNGTGTSISSSRSAWNLQSSRGK